MEAVILAGGKGSRLRPYTTIIPKPLMPVGEQAILEIVIRQLQIAGVKKITLAVNHGADIIRAFVGSGEKLGIKIAYSFEDKPLGTVGPLKLIQDLPENFIVMNGDVLTDLNYTDLYADHLKAGTELTISTYRRIQKIDFGVLEIDSDANLIKGFREKPFYDFNVSMGIYVFKHSLLELIPFNVPYGLDDLVLMMLKNGRPIHAYPYDGYWLDIGRPEDYDQANNDIGKIQLFKRR